MKLRQQTADKEANASFDRHLPSRQIVRFGDRERRAAPAREVGGDTEKVDCLVNKMPLTDQLNVVGISSLSIAGCPLPNNTGADVGVPIQELGSGQNQNSNTSCNKSH
jgi:hypothetical protein